VKYSWEMYMGKESENVAEIEGAVDSNGKEK
jgi:hypothetical protein